MWESQGTPKRKREFRKTAAPQMGELVNRGSGGGSVQGNQKSTQRFKVVQGGNPLRPPISQRRGFTKLGKVNPKTGFIQCFVIKKKRKKKRGRESFSVGALLQKNEKPRNP
ncbi:hypothetical protein AXF42_Ash015398 [Apostasia shenzhenica]|uniref:Uncharacterized protein n=1 Tax=Apostasia shenzhenica TaxID=1088818 RepID=A0A2H9ZS37_9ASPA|nr:hypothetical protein AXF42_Ash015398 [Apostasia shenzhenica]